MNARAIEYAGFWRRFAALWLDGVVIAASVNVLRAYALYPEIMKLPDFVPAVYSVVVGSVFAWLYFCGMESSPMQATLGKWLVGIFVADYAGHRITFGRATGRYFGKALSYLILGIGFLMAGFTERKQGLHDIMAECVVVSR